MNVRKETMKNIIEPLQNVDYDDVFETIQNDAQTRGLSDEKVWEIWQAGLARKEIMNHREALLLLLDCIDYESGACRVNEPIGGVLPVEVLRRAKLAAQQPLRQTIQK